MKRIVLGAMLLTALGLGLSRCASSRPPVIQICTLDGFGGADCELGDVQTYRSPSQMKNYWATKQEDMARFSSWCYQEPGSP